MCIFSRLTSIVTLYALIHSWADGRDRNQKEKQERLMVETTLLSALVLSTAFQCTNQVTLINQVYLLHTHQCILN
jgi:hypothetical protein